MRLLKLVTILLLVTTNCWAFTGAAKDDANCQAAWLMEVNEDPITDSSQNTNTGAAAGDPTHTTADPPAAYSTGYWNFDQVTDRFDVTNHASLAPGGDFSIVAWIRMTSYGDSSFGRIFDDSNSATGGGYSWYVNDDGSPADGMSINISDGVLVTSNSDSSIITTGTWYHVAVVFDDSENDVTFYVNAVDKGGTANTKTPGANTVDATIGDRHDNTRQFDGDIDELAFFDRTISQAEVQDIMDNGLEGVTADASQVIMIYD